MTLLEEDGDVLLTVLALNYIVRKLHHEEVVDSLLLRDFHQQLLSILAFASLLSFPSSRAAPGRARSPVSVCEGAVSIRIRLPFTLFRFELFLRYSTIAD